MKTIHLVVAFVAAVSMSAASNRAAADVFGSGVNRFEIAFVPIGDPGNLADTTGKPSPVGLVDYIYNIGKYEISRDMIEKANGEAAFNDGAWPDASFGHGRSLVPPGLSSGDENYLVFARLSNMDHRSSEANWPELRGFLEHSTGLQI